MKRTMQTLVAAGALALGATAWSQTVLDSPELYAGEKPLYEAAKKEGNLQALLG